jgi:hypothetical protein
MTTTDSGSDDIHHDGEHYHTTQFPVIGTYKSADIPIAATPAELEVILENMPNIQDITVTGNSGANYTITFTEDVQNMPAFVMDYALAKCNNGNTSVSVSETLPGNFPGTKLSGGNDNFDDYTWMTVPASSSEDPRFFVLEDLIPGKEYFVRVSAKNDLGYGTRRVTAPGSLKVPITQPTVPTSLEANWTKPSLFIASETSLLVKVGAPTFNGGSPVSHFDVEWDTSPAFDSGTSNTALGKATVSAFKTLCANCVDRLEYDYNTAIGENNYNVFYSPIDDDITRELITGERVTIITHDDYISIPYSFIVTVKNSTQGHFGVMSNNHRETVFEQRDVNIGEVKGDLLLMGAQYEIMGLTPGQVYHVRVSAVNSNGTCATNMRNQPDRAAIHQGGVDN